jgi:hypothetical protein
MDVGHRGNLLVVQQTDLHTPLNALLPQARAAQA